MSRLAPTQRGGQCRPLDLSKDLLQRTLLTFGFLTGMLTKDDVVLGFPDFFFQLAVEEEEARCGLNRFTQNGLSGQDLFELILPLPFKKFKFRAVSTNSNISPVSGDRLQPRLSLGHCDTPSTIYNNSFRTPECLLCLR